jgi:ABC-2 type transport system permease protein
MSVQSTATGPLGAAAPTSSWEQDRPRLGFMAYYACFKGIVWREVLRYLHQRERFLSALVRPLVWLFIFAAGFRQTLGVSIIPPYETYVLYEVFITPGLIGMIQLFNAMQSSLSMVYDRETGAMRTLLVSPFPRSYLLLSKLVGGVAVSLLQVYAFLLVAYFWEIEPPLYGYLTVLPALILSGLMLGSLALFMSSIIRQLENFAGVMNFVIFPMFFASSALYPLWRVRESSVLLYDICLFNPFTHAVELIRFALYGQLNWTALAVVLGCTALFLGGAVYAYNPSKGLIARRGGPGAGA